MDDVAALLAKVNFGTVPGWLQLAVWLLILWRGVPAFLDAITNRQSKLEERMEARLKEADERYLKQIEAADKRHDECVRGQERLQTRVDTLEGQVSALQTENRGLKRQIVQMQVSTLRVTPHSAGNGVLEAMIEQLDQVASPKREGGA